MKCTIIEEHGYEMAIRGMSYSHFDTDLDLSTWWPEQRPRAEVRASKLAGKGGGHDKFLESIYVWADVLAPRSFWQEMDTYRVGVSKQSTSTMHKLEKRRPKPSDFEPSTPPEIIEAFINIWDTKPGLEALKHALPEGYLQLRMVCMNYKTLQNIYRQRLKHRYKLWGHLLESALRQLEHPELITAGSL